MKTIFKPVLFFCLALLAFPALFAQPVVYSGGGYTSGDSAAVARNKKGDYVVKPMVNVTIGTSFSNFGYGYNGFGTYIAPELSVPLNRKFSLSAGIAYSSMFYGGPGESLAGGMQQSYGSINVSGTYQVNPDLIIRGTAYKTFQLGNGSPGQSINPQLLDFSSQGMIFDAEYKINPHFKVGVSVEYREQNYPAYLYSPFGHRQPGIRGFNNPATGSSPFGW